MFRFKFVRSSFAFSEIIPELANLVNERMNRAWLKPMTVHVVPRRYSDSHKFRAVAASLARLIGK